MLAPWARADPDRRIGDPEDGLTLEYLLDPEEVCNGFRREEGEPTAKHVDPYEFDPRDLEDMYRYTCCPSHLSEPFEDVPEGVWKREVALATVLLDQVSAEHGSPLSHDCEHVAEVWERFPQAERWFRHYEVPIPPGCLTTCAGDGCTAPHACGTCDADLEGDA